ncbi:MAG: hypothetical protein QM752_00265 [Gammaproteobacteria bacterium]
MGCTILGEDYQAILDAQWRYYQDISLKALDLLPPETAKLLTNPAICSFLEEHFNSIQGSEFYLLNEQGSYLMVNAKGEKFWMILTNDKALESYYEIAVDHQAKASILSDLKNKNKVPFLLTEKQHRLTVAEWPKYMHSIKPIPNTEGSYYAFIQDKKGLYEEPCLYAVSHEKYLEQLET